MKEPKKLSPEWLGKFPQYEIMSLCIRTKTSEKNPEPLALVFNHAQWPSISIKQRGVQFPSATRRVFRQELAERTHPYRLTMLYFESWEHLIEAELDYSDPKSHFSYWRNLLQALKTSHLPKPEKLPKLPI